MKRILVFCSLALSVFACNKDKFQTKPQIKIKSVSSSTVPLNSDVSVVLEFTDKEGDVSDSILMVRRRLNMRGPAVDTFGYKIPAFPNTSSGEIELDLRYAYDLTVGLLPISIPGTGSGKEPDSLSLQFVARDKAGNKSDTATTQLIVIRK